jgi:hypothetical protein
VVVATVFDLWQGLAATGVLFFPGPQGSLPRPPALVWWAVIFHRSGPRYLPDRVTGFPLTLELTVFEHSDEHVIIFEEFSLIHLYGYWIFVRKCLIL